MCFLLSHNFTYLAWRPVCALVCLHVCVWFPSLVVLLIIVDNFVIEAGTIDVNADADCLEDAVG